MKKSESNDFDSSSAELEKKKFNKKGNVEREEVFTL